MKTENGIITLTEPNEVFVFGSNADGHHNAGAAKYALDHYGAVYGQGHGLQGRSYAIDTMSGMKAIQSGVETLLAYAVFNPDTVFVMTPIGCGIAGYTKEDIAPLFVNATANVVLPEEWL